MQRLIEKGARRIAITGIPPLGSTPSSKGGRLGVTSDQLNQAALQFNQGLQTLISNISNTSSSPDVEIIYVDIYNTFLDILANSISYGFKVTDRGYCGTGRFELSILCNPIVPTCRNASEYAFWNAVHLTETFYRAFANIILARDI